MRHLLACMAVALLLGAGAPKDDGKKDKEKLQGTWKAVTVEAAGQSHDDAEEHRLIFSGDEFSVKKGEETMIKGKFKIDASKKPNEINMEFTGGKRENLKGMTSLGIYELAGDTLKWCWNRPGGERPKEFSSQAANVHLLVTLKREQSKFQQGSYSGTLPRGDKVAFKFDDKGNFVLTDKVGKALVEGTYKVMKDQIEFTDEKGPIASRGPASTTGSWKTRS